MLSSRSGLAVVVVFFGLICTGLSITGTVETDRLSVRFKAAVLAGLRVALVLGTYILSRALIL